MDPTGSNRLLFQLTLVYYVDNMNVKSSAGTYANRVKNNYSKSSKSTSTTSQQIPN